MLDKAASVLSALESGPATLAGLVTATGLARPTAHRLAVALEHHRLVARDMQGRFMLGPRLGELSAAAGEDRLLAAAGPVLARLRDITGESAQLFRRQGDARVCVAAAERPSGLRDSIPVGSQLSMLAGSAAQILLAWEEPDRLHRGLHGAAFNAATLGEYPASWLGPECRRTRGRGRVGLGRRALAVRQGDRRDQRLGATRTDDPSAGPDARTRRPCRGREAHRVTAPYRRLTPKRQPGADCRHSATGCTSRSTG